MFKLINIELKKVFKHKNIIVFFIILLPKFSPIDKVYQ